MNCQQIHKLLPAHHDGELDAAHTLLIDEHLADCPGCFEAVRQLSALRAAVQEPALRFSAPPGLRQSISAAVARAARAESESPETNEGAVSRPWRPHLGWAAAAVLLAALLLRFPSFSARNDDRLLADLEAGHVRSLMAAHLLDVASTDQHTVKPWFDGKLDFAPPVKDLRDAGFPLLGGRLDFVAGHPAAALVYGRQRHFLNLFVWPAGPDAAVAEIRAMQRDGYNILRWSNGEMDFSLVSDLNEAELRQFVQTWSSR